MEAVEVLAIDLLLRGDEPDVVDLRLCAVVGAAGDRDLELPREVGVLAVLGEEVRDGSMTGCALKHS